MSQLRSLGVLGQTIPAGFKDVLDKAILSVGGILAPDGSIIEDKLIEARNLIIEGLQQLGIIGDEIPEGLIEQIDQALIAAAKDFASGFDLSSLAPWAIGGILLFLLLGKKKK